MPTSDLSLNDDLNKSEYAAIIQQPVNESHLSPLTDRYEFNTCIESSNDSITMGEQPQWASGIYGPNLLMQSESGNMDQMGTHLSQSYQFTTAENLTLD